MPHARARSRRRAGRARCCSPPARPSRPFYGLSTLPGPPSPPAADYATRWSWGSRFPRGRSARDDGRGAGRSILVPRARALGGTDSDLIQRRWRSTSSSAARMCWSPIAASIRRESSRCTSRWRSCGFRASRRPSDLGGALENPGRRGATRSARRRELFFADRRGRLRLDSPRLQPMPGVARRSTGGEAPLTMSPTRTSRLERRAGRGLGFD